MPCLLDPGAPGVSKQMMLDWMHINHPKITIRPRIDPASLAELVRSVQPEYFSDPSSDARADVVVNNSRIKVSNITKDQSAFTPGDIPSSTSGHPKYPSLQEFQDQKPPIPVSSKATTGIGRPAKRLASSEVKKSPKSNDLGLEVPGKSSKISKKKKITHLSTTANKSASVFAAGIDPTILPSTSSGPVIPTTSLTFNHDEKELQELRESLDMPTLHRPRTTTKSNASKRDATKTPPISDHLSRQTVSYKPEDPSTTEDKDLIDFSDTHVMDVGNQVLGKDIPTISPTHANGKKRSGIDVFKEERGREERFCQLEASFAQLLEEVGQLSANVFQSKMKLAEQEHKTQMLEAAQERMEKTANVKSIIDPKVSQLESRVNTLRREVDKDHAEIETHGQILARLMASDEEEDESSE